MGNSLIRRFAQRKYWLPLAIAGALVFATAGTLTIMAYQQQMSLPVYLQSFSTPQITVAELTSGKFKPVILIDVRSPDEYQEDHIGNSPLVPFTDIEAGLGLSQLQAIIKNYEKQNLANPTKPTIVLYCTSGQRSIKANKYLATLSDRGYQVLTLTGGITAWRKQVQRSQDLQITFLK
ncbi:rhodanese-like domain-containing protein [Pseudanabaena sp. FACHB-1998]|uniref:rhodanese-like domain-containing protein n=1 Tax=Pseudanabaena sp. FACHB-1998 TaxID=2692858 RepID=UPI001680B01F|nr:rhodanese-like domain-containing protein [Pseudanabaena sp. FACHB-1998]MBD2175334.1 rhodanese-like domain-containing protein [Pseudanabaena sp. FACHB-1998]